MFIIDCYYSFTRSISSLMYIRGEETFFSFSLSLFVFTLTCMLLLLLLLLLFVSLVFFLSCPVREREKFLSFRQCCRQFEVSVGGRRDVNVLVVKKERKYSQIFKNFLLGVKHQSSNSQHYKFNDNGKQKWNV